MLYSFETETRSSCCARATQRNIDIGRVVTASGFEYSAGKIAGGTFSSATPARRVSEALDARSPRKSERKRKKRKRSTRSRSRGGPSRSSPSPPPPPPRNFLQSYAARRVRRCPLDDASTRGAGAQESGAHRRATRARGLTRCFGREAAGRGWGGGSLPPLA